MALTTPAERCHSAGIAALNAGGTAIAIAQLRIGTELAPGMARYWSNLGEALRRQGEFEEALRCCERSVEIDPDYAKGWRGLGAVRFALGRYDMAELAFQRWLALADDAATAHAFLADCARVRGQAGLAIERYRLALAIDPRHRHGLLNLPHVLLLTGAEEEALTIAEQACQHWPNDAEMLISRGRCLQSLERYEAAMDEFADAWELAPDSLSLCCQIAEVWEQLGELIQADLWLARAREMDAGSVDVRLRQASLLRVAEQADDALVLLAQLRVEHPDHLEIRAQQARAEFESGDAEAALLTYRALIQAQPDNAAHDIALAHVQVALGDLDAATDRFRRAIAKNARALGAVAGLATTLRAKLPEPEYRMLVASLGRPELPDNLRAQLQMGLAMVLDGRALHAQAAPAALEANRLQALHSARRHRAYQPEDFDLQVAAIQRCFSRERMQQLAASGNPDERPTFIIGMPRSGTTLTEQILNAHPEILGVGERPYALRSLLRWTHSKDPAAALEVIEQQQLAAPTEAAEWQLTRLLELAKKSAGAIAPRRIVDKMPDNYQWAGLLHTMFPNARLIHLRRDPRDVALSNWMNLFAQIRWANELDHIAHRLIAHHRLMQHWRRSLPVGVLIEIDYEKLAAQPEQEARRLIDGLGLDWHPACLQFHQQRSLVRTASVTQVREPVYTRSVERWRPYADVLAPLVARLREAGVLPIEGP